MADLSAVELANVTKRFRGPQNTDVLAVENISISIKNGEFFSLLGSSGCGKSTTLRMIAGFEMPTSGDIKILDQSMGDTPPHLRPVNMVFQSYALFPHMTVYENVAFGLRMDGIDKNEIKQRVEQALDLVQLGGKGNRRPKQLSGGQQQRVALARALVKRPALLLLDEPLGALDRKLRKAMQLELKHMQQTLGITFIYVTHDQEEAITMSDRIAVMNLGHVLQVGTPLEIYEEPHSKFVADFIGESNFIPGVVTALDARTAKIEVGSNLEFILPLPNIPLVVGRKVTIMVRPEKGIVTNQIPEGPAYCTMPGHLLEMIYLGDDMSYLVSIADLINITIRSQNLQPTHFNDFQQGKSVYVSWNINSLKILSEDQ